jgi:hypothetical protein
MEVQMDGVSTLVTTECSDILEVKVSTQKEFQTSDLTLYKFWGFFLIECFLLH